MLPTGPDARSLAARGADLARRLRAGAADVLLANGVKARPPPCPPPGWWGVPVVWAKHDFSFDSTWPAPWARSRRRARHLGRVAAARA